MAYIATAIILQILFGFASLTSIIPATAPRCVSQEYRVVLDSQDSGLTSDIDAMKLRFEFQGSETKLEVSDEEVPENVKEGTKILVGSISTCEETDVIQLVANDVTLASQDVKTFVPFQSITSIVFETPARIYRTTPYVMETGIHYTFAQNEKWLIVGTNIVDATAVDIYTVNPGKTTSYTYHSCIVNREQGPSSFGKSLALDGDTLIIGAPGQSVYADDTEHKLISIGTVLIYNYIKETNAWKNIAILYEDLGDTDCMGQECYTGYGEVVMCVEGLLAVSAPFYSEPKIHIGETVIRSHAHTGSLFIYKFKQTKPDGQSAWQLVQRLRRPVVLDESNFGISASMSPISHNSNAGGISDGYVLLVSDETGAVFFYATVDNFIQSSNNVFNPLKDITEDNRPVNERIFVLEHVDRSGNTASVSVSGAFGFLLSSYANDIRVFQRTPGSAPMKWVSYSYIDGEYGACANRKLVASEDIVILTDPCHSVSKSNGNLVSTTDFGWYTKQTPDPSGRVTIFGRNSRDTTFTILTHIDGVPPITPLGLSIIIGPSQRSLLLAGLVDNPVVLVEHNIGVPFEAVAFLTPSVQPPDQQINTTAIDDGETQSIDVSITLWNVLGDRVVLKVMLEEEDNSSVVTSFGGVSYLFNGVEQHDLVLDENGGVYRVTKEMHVDQEDVFVVLVSFGQTLGPAVASRIQLRVQFDTVVTLLELETSYVSPPTGPDLKPVEIRYRLYTSSPESHILTATPVHDPQVLLANYIPTRGGWCTTNGFLRQLASFDKDTATYTVTASPSYLTMKSIPVLCLSSVYNETIPSTVFVAMTYGPSSRVEIAGRPNPAQTSTIKLALYNSAGFLIQDERKVSLSHNGQRLLCSYDHGSGLYGASMFFNIEAEPVLVVFDEVWGIESKVIEHVIPLEYDENVTQLTVVDITESHGGVISVAVMLQDHEGMRLTTLRNVRGGFNEKDSVDGVFDYAHGTYTFEKLKAPPSGVYAMHVYVQGVDGVIQLEAAVEVSQSDVVGAIPVPSQLSCGYNASVGVSLTGSNMFPVAPANNEVVLLMLMSGEGEVRDEVPLYYDDGFQVFRPFVPDAPRGSFYVPCSWSGMAMVKISRPDDRNVLVFPISFTITSKGSGPSLSSTSITRNVVLAAAVVDFAILVFVSLLALAWRDKAAKMETIDGIQNIRHRIGRESLGTLLDPKSELHSSSPNSGSEVARTMVKLNQRLVGLPKQQKTDAPAKPSRVSWIFT